MVVLVVALALGLTIYINRGQIACVVQGGNWIGVENETPEMYKGLEGPIPSPGCIPEVELIP